MLQLVLSIAGVLATLITVFCWYVTVSRRSKHNKLANMTPSKALAQTDGEQWVTGRLKCDGGPSEFSMVPYPICELRIYVDKFGGDEETGRTKMRVGIPYLLQKFRGRVRCEIGGKSVAIEEHWDNSNQGKVARDKSGKLEFLKTEEPGKVAKILKTLGMEDHEIAAFAYVRIEVWPINQTVQLVGEFANQNGNFRMISGEVFRENPTEVLSRRIGGSDNWTAVTTVLTVLIWGGLVLSFFVGN